MFCLCVKDLPFEEKLKLFSRSFQFTIYSDSVFFVADTIIFTDVVENAVISEVPVCGRPSYIPLITQSIHICDIIKGWNSYLCSKFQEMEIMVEGFDCDKNRSFLKVKVSNPRTDCGNLIFNASVIEDEDVFSNYWNCLDRLTEVSFRIDNINENFILVDDDLPPEDFLNQEILSSMKKDEIDEIRNIIKEIILSQN